MHRSLPLPLALLLIACGSKDTESDSETTPTASGCVNTWTCSTDSTPTGSTTESGDTGDSGTSDNHLAIYIGDAAVDLGAGTWAGTESMRVVNALTGSLVCQWTWTATDWQHDPTVATLPEPVSAPCVDDDGNACTFSFNVNLTDGFQTDGACAAFAPAVAGGAYAYGWADDWQTGGIAMGPAFAYYLPGPTSGTWFPASLAGYAGASWDSGAGTLDYELTKTLLETYATP